MRSFMVKAPFMVICAVLMCMALVSKGYAATYCVDDTSDGAASAADCDSDCTDGSANCSLRDALEAANGNAGADVIDLTGVTGTITLLSVLPNVSDSVSLTGPGAASLSIDGNAGGYRFFFFDSPTNDQVFSVSGLTLTNASGTSAGTVFYVMTGETVTVDSCTITNNNGSGLGNSGTMSVGSSTGYTSTLNILNSTITNNTVGNMGGGVHNGCSQGTCLLNIENSTISTNRAGRWGGGVSSSNSGATTTVVNSLVSDNQADYDNDDVDEGHGGGMNSNGGVLIVKNSTLTGNSSNGGGGAVASVYSDSSITLINTTVSGNRADRSDGGSYSGGGLFDDGFGGTISVQNSIIADNVVTTSDTPDNCDGNNIASNGNNIESGDDCGFTGTGDFQNTDPLLGTLADNGGPTLTFALLDGSPAIDAGNDSACVDADMDGKDQRGYARCSDAIVGGSKVDIGSYEVRAFTVDDPGTDGDSDAGDGVCDNGHGVCTLRAAIEESNALSGDDIVNFSITGTIDLTSTMSPIDGMVIEGPGAESLTLNATGGDPVIRFAKAAASETYSMSGLTITGGYGVGAGVIVGEDDTLTISDCVITGNTATSVGAGIFLLSGASLALVDSTVADNLAGSVAGGIYAQSGTTLDIRGSTIANNRNGQSGGTDNAGGGILCNACDTMNISNSTISGNEATGSGAGIAVLDGTMNLSNVTLVDNAADSDAGADGTGGGIAVSGAATVNVKNTIVAGNSDNGNGGADCSGTIVSGDYNIIQDTTGCTVTGTVTNNITGRDPLLAVLASYGGSSQTHALTTGSPALDAGNPAGCTDENDDDLTTDQRGFTRSTNGRCDIGAYENGSCGDGVLDADEECDNAGANSDTTADACRTTCANPSCGDGVIDAGEGCDDGNTADGDGCQANCALATCGDGVVDAGEECDDGAANSDTESDACRTTCVAASCGDGSVDTDEGCDDGNANEADGCLGTCVAIAGDMTGANPDVDFDNLIVGEATALTAPDPTAGGTSSSLAIAKALPAGCACAWSVEAATLGAFSDASSCETSFTPAAAGEGSLFVSVDCGSEGSGNYLQSITTVAATTVGAVEEAGGGSGGGCALIPQTQTMPLFVLVPLLLSLPAVIFTRRRSMVS